MRHMPATRSLRHRIRRPRRRSATPAADSGTAARHDEAPRSSGWVDPAPYAAAIRQQLGWTIPDRDTSGQPAETRHLPGKTTPSR